MGLGILAMILGSCILGSLLCRGVGVFVGSVAMKGVNVGVNINMVVMSCGYERYCARGCV